MGISSLFLNLIYSARSYAAANYRNELPVVVRQSADLIALEVT